MTRNEYVYNKLEPVMKEVFDALHIIELKEVLSN